MVIEDLEISKELTGKDLVAVSGGTTLIGQGGATQVGGLTLSQGGSGFSLFNIQIGVNAPVNVNAPTAVVTDLNTELNSLTNVLGQQYGFQAA